MVKNRFYSKIIYLFLALAAIGCEPKQKREHKILFISKNTKNDFHKTIAKGAIRQGSQSNIRVDVVGSESESDFETQRQAIARSIKTHEYDAVILEPNHSSEFIKDLLQLNNEKIPFVIVDTPVNFSGELPARFCSFVGTDNLLGGKLAAQFIEKRLKRANVVLIRGLPEHRSSQDREQGFIDGLSHGSSEVKVVKTLNGKWTPEDALKEFKDFLKKTPQKIDAVFALNDDMALAIASFYADKPHRPLIIGFNGSKEAQKNMLLGKLDASIVQMPEEMGIEAVKIALTCIKKTYTGLAERRHLTPVTTLFATKSVNLSTDYGEVQR